MEPTPGLLSCWARAGSDATSRLAQRALLTTNYHLVLRFRARAKNRMATASLQNVLQISFCSVVFSTKTGNVLQQETPEIQGF
jgi:hypothetical protein